MILIQSLLTLRKKNIHKILEKKTNRYYQIKEYLTIEEIQKIENLTLRAFYTQLRTSKQSNIESSLKPLLRYSESVRFNSISELENG